MSTQTLIPGLFLSRFRATFHPDFPYNSSPRQNTVILESAEGVRFHFSLPILLDSSTVFADASALACDDHASRPILLMFASTAGLHYFLTILEQSRRHSVKQNEDRKESAVTPETTIAAIRITHILDAPTVARYVLSRVGVDVYLRFAMERLFEEKKPLYEHFRHPPLRLRGPADISFSLHPHEQYERSVMLLQEINPSAAKTLVKFHDDRQKAVRAVEQWWSTGIRVGRVLRSDRPPQTMHQRSCKKRFASKYAFARDLPKIVPRALVVLAKSKSKIERARNIGASLMNHANGCKGCLTRLEAVYMPALRSFDADFPAIPK